ncbi:MAG: hypothetical protein ACPGJS_10120 [Flammeovirgaceae bacterium]
MEVKKEIKSLTKPDRALLIRNAKMILLTGVLFTTGVAILLLIFAWDFIFSGDTTDRIVIASIGGLPISVVFGYYLFAKIDLMIGKKEVITGILKEKKTRVLHTSGGNTSTTRFYFELDNLYQVPDEHYASFEVGDKITLHRTRRTKSVFLVE